LRNLFSLESDEDEFDRVCEHLIVRAVAGGLLGQKTIKTDVSLLVFLQNSRRVACPRKQLQGDGQTVRVPSAFFQPILSDDVVAALVDVTLGAPVNGIIDLAGPERFRFDEIIRQFLGTTQDTRQVVTDMHACYFGAKLDDQSLVPGGNSLLGATRFED
jgi:hypothetical protein